MKYTLENGALNYLHELLKDEKYYTEQLEDSYVMLNACRNQRNKLENEKQQLIKFLENKIKEYESLIFENSITASDNEILFYKQKLTAFQEILDFVNKGGKE